MGNRSIKDSKYQSALFEFVALIPITATTKMKQMNAVLIPNNGALIYAVQIWRSHSQPN